MRVSLPSPALPFGLAVGAALALGWPDPAREAEARIAELERQIERAQTRNALRTVLRAPTAAEPQEFPADPVVWSEPWRPPPGDHPELAPEVLRAVLAELIGDPDDVLAVTCEPYPCRALVVGAGSELKSQLEARGYDPMMESREERFQIPTRSWDVVRLRVDAVAFPAERPPDDTFGVELLTALFHTERPGIEAALESALVEAWAARLAEAGEPFPPELVAELR